MQNPTSAWESTINKKSSDFPSNGVDNDAPWEIIFAEIDNLKLH